MNSALLIFDEIELPFHGILKPMTLWESLTPSISVVKIWYQLAANPHAS